MSAKLAATLLAVVLMLGYVGPMILKMKDLPLAAVIGIGVAAMLVDLWQMLRGREGG